MGREREREKVKKRENINIYGLCMMHSPILTIRTGLKLQLSLLRSLHSQLELLGFEPMTI